MSIANPQNQTARNCATAELPEVGIIRSARVPFVQHNESQSCGQPPLRNLEAISADLQAGVHTDHFLPHRCRGLAIPAESPSVRADGQSRPRMKSEHILATEHLSGDTALRNGCDQFERSRNHDDSAVTGKQLAEMGLNFLDCGHRVPMLF